MRIFIIMATILTCGCGEIAGNKKELTIRRYDAEAIVKSGGGVTVSAENMSRYDLEAIAEAATEGNARLVVVHSSKLSRYDMEAIGKAGPGLVLFEN